MGTTMFTRIRQFLAAPVFEDEDKTRVARLLNTVLWAFVAVMLVYGIVALVLPNPIAALPLVAIVIATGVGSFVLLRRGHVQAAGLLFSSAIWFFLTMEAIFFDGMDGPAVFGYIVVIIIAGLLLGPRGGTFFGVLSSAAGLGMVWAASSGVLPEALGPNSPLAKWISLSLYIILTGMLLRIATGSLNEALTRARRYAAELAEQRERLEETVRERTRDLEYQAAQLAAVADMTRAIASTLELPPLTRQAVELLHKRFDLHYAGLFLLDDAGEHAVLEAYTSLPDQFQAHERKLTAEDDSVVARAWTQRQAHTAQLDPADPSAPAARSEIALPLIVGDRLLGVLHLQSARPQAFFQENAVVLQLAADQVAVAVDNARRISGQATLLEATSPIYRAGRRLTGATTTNEVAAAIIDSIAETQADGCVVVKFEFAPTGEPEALLYLGVWRRDRVPQFESGMRIPFEESPFPLEMVSTSWAVSDAEVDERLPASAREVFGATGTHALANIPLRSGDRIVGQVVVLRTVPGPFSDADLRLYEALGDQASVALERVRLLEETQRLVSREQVIGQVATRVRETLDMDTMLQTAIQEIGEALGMAAVEVRMYDSQMMQKSPEERLPAAL